MQLTTIRCSSIVCGGISLMCYAQLSSCCLEDIRSNEVRRQTTLFSITYDCSFQFFRALYTIWVTFLCMRGRYKITSVQRNANNLKVSSHIAQYPILTIAQSALHFTSLTDLFNQKPSQLLAHAQKRQPDSL